MSVPKTPCADQRPPRPRGPFQFRLGTLFLLMLVVSVAASALTGLLRRGAASAPMPWEFYLVMLVAAPLGVMIVLSLLYAAIRWLRQVGRRDEE